MSPYTKGALFLIRLAGTGFMVISMALLWSDVLLFLTHRPITSPAVLILKGLPFVLGSVICWKSYPMAKSLTRDLDDE